MKTIRVDYIKKSVADLCGQANFRLRPDVLSAMAAAYRKETASCARDVLKAILDNARIASQEDIAICQDTGIAVVFVRLGQDVHIAGGSLQEAINKGVDLGYRQARLRNSIVKDPLRRGKPGFSPAVIHYEIVAGDKMQISMLPKGFGCENKSQARMFKPTADIETIKRFIIDVVRQAGPDACPPYVVGVGIGGTHDYACLLAKKALLSKIKARPQGMEKELLSDINKLNIGPMGLGGKTTALAVNILIHPTHIAGLPVCVNISCHALRSATKTL
jgi:fumarate hydratase subunit alpha